MPSKTFIKNSKNSGPKPDRLPPDNSNTRTTLRNPSFSRPAVRDAGTQTDPVPSTDHGLTQTYVPDHHHGDNDDYMSRVRFCPRDFVDEADIIRGPFPEHPVPRLPSIERVGEESVADWMGCAGRDDWNAATFRSGSGNPLEESTVSRPKSEVTRERFNTLTLLTANSPKPDHISDNDPRPDGSADKPDKRDKLEMHERGRTIKKPNQKDRRKAAKERRRLEAENGGIDAKSSSRSTWTRKHVDIQTMAEMPSSSKSNASIKPHLTSSKTSDPLGTAGTSLPDYHEICQYPWDSFSSRHRKYKDDDDKSGAAIAIAITDPNDKAAVLMTLAELMQWLKLEATKKPIKRPVIKVTAARVACFRAPQDQGYRTAQMNQQPKLRQLERTLQASGGSSNSETNQTQEDPAVRQIRAREAAERRAEAKNAMADSTNGSLKASKIKGKKSAASKSAQSTLPTAPKKNTYSRTSSLEVDIGSATTLPGSARRNAISSASTGDSPLVMACKTPLPSDNADGDWNADDYLSRLHSADELLANLRTPDWIRDVSVPLPKSTFPTTCLYANSPKPPKIIHQGLELKFRGIQKNGDTSVMTKTPFRDLEILNDSRLRNVERRRQERKVKRKNLKALRKEKALGSSRSQLSSSSGPDSVEAATLESSGAYERVSSLEVEVGSPAFDTSFPRSNAVSDLSTGDSDFVTACKTALPAGDGNGDEPSQPASMPKGHYLETSIKENQPPNWILDVDAPLPEPASPIICMTGYFGQRHVRETYPNREGDINKAILRNKELLENERARNERLAEERDQQVQDRYAALKKAKATELLTSGVQDYDPLHASTSDISTEKTSDAESTSSDGAASTLAAVNLRERPPPSGHLATAALNTTAGRTRVDRGGKRGRGAKR